MSQEQVAAADLLQVEQEARNAAVKASGEFLRTVGVGAVAAPSDSTCYRCKGSFRYYALCSENSMEAVEEESAASSAESGRQEKDSGKKKTEARICVSCEVKLRTEQWPSFQLDFKRKFPDYCTEGEVRRDFKRVNKGKTWATSSRIFPEMKHIVAHEKMTGANATLTKRDKCKMVINETKKMAESMLEESE